MLIRRGPVQWPGEAGLPGLPGVGLTLGAACAEPGHSERSERLAAGPAVTVGALGRDAMVTPPSAAAAAAVQGLQTCRPGRRAQFWG